jgi:hypothetical protein
MVPAKIPQVLQRVLEGQSFRYPRFQHSAISDQLFWLLIADGFHWSLGT